MRCEGDVVVFIVVVMLFSELELVGGVLMIVLCFFVEGFKVVELIGVVVDFYFFVVLVYV